MAAAVTKAFDVEEVRSQFPALDVLAGAKPLVYLDNAATSQKPQAVLDALDDFWRHSNANVHRGVHYLSRRATDLFDDARETVRRFLNAREVGEVVFTKGCSEGINLVASSYARAKLEPGDEIVVGTNEHHSNIVPWQLVAEQKGATVKPIRIDDRGVLDLQALGKMLSPRVKVVAVKHVCNALGTVNPVKQIAAMAHAEGAILLVDGAQAGPHVLIDVQDLDADFYTLSCHKIYAPTGVGVLYGKYNLLNGMPPYQGGGDMIKTVRFSGTTYAAPPARFEAGTPNVAGVVGLGAALSWLMAMDRTAIAEHERDLTAYATEALGEVRGLKLYGAAPERTSILSFTLDFAHPHDIGTVLDSEGVAVRAGHHCCMPLMERFNIPATARASLALYSTRADVDALVRGIHKVREVFG